MPAHDPAPVAAPDATRAAVYETAPAAAAELSPALREPAPPTETAAHEVPVLALDLGGTLLRTAVVDGRGGVRARRRISSPIDLGADGVVERCVATLRESVEEHLAAGGVAPDAIGVSAPGPLDTARGILVDPPNLGDSFRDFPLAQRLSDAFGLPCRVERDTHVAALAEGAFGAAVGLSDYVYMTVSTGIGGGIVAGGRLMGGADGMAGELGHLLVDMNGLECTCGAVGHLERYSSGTGIARSATEALAAGTPAPILEAIALSIAPAPLEGVHVATAEEAGDPLAAELMAQARRAFAAAMIAIVNVFAPERVIVGGGVAAGQGERLLGPAREAVARYSFKMQARRAEIVPAALGDDVGLIGSVPLVRAPARVGG